LSLEWKNDGVMDDNSGDDDTGEVRWSWKRDESGRGRSRYVIYMLLLCVDAVSGGAGDRRRWSKSSSPGAKHSIRTISLPSTQVCIINRFMY